MQTRRTNTDHHHQPKVFALPPKAELIGLARGKGQVLTEYTFNLIRDTLELRGVSLEDFVADVRPHFRNNILNPSGFLVDRARRCHQLSRAAVAPALSLPAAETKKCSGCDGQRYVIGSRDIEPCPECSTPEFRTEWEIREKERARKRSTTEMK
jgi:hypothetical protein